MRVEDDPIMAVDGLSGNRIQAEACMKRSILLDILRWYLFREANNFLAKNGKGLCRGSLDVPSSGPHETYSSSVIHIFAI
jgi:hypothetical protein